MKLYEAFGKLHDINQDCFINTRNFAINDRCYDPTCVLSGVKTDQGVAAYDPLEMMQVNNLHTGFGLSKFHEERWVGKSIFIIDLQNLKNNGNVIAGVNTINNKIFDLIIEAGSGTNFPRNSMMYVWAYYDNLL